MELNDLKETLKQHGIPLYKNDKIRKKDFEYLKSRPSELVVKGIKYLNIEKDVDKYIFKFMISIPGANKERIENIFTMNKPNVCEDVLDFLQKKVDYVTGIDCCLKAVNSDTAWVDLVVNFSLDKDEITFDMFEPFWHRAFEKITLRD